MKQLFLCLALLITLGLLACKKKHACYDATMEANHPGICVQDCPGVCGCDGQTYCNECIANSQGIAIVANTPCD